MDLLAKKKRQTSMYLSIDVLEFLGTANREFHNEMGDEADQYPSISQAKAAEACIRRAMREIEDGSLTYEQLLFGE